MYSQNLEEKFILEYFGNKKGHLLDVGANDGETFSNSRALIKEGWSADLIEPSPSAFTKLTNLYTTHKNVIAFNYAIASQEGYLDFYESGTLLRNGDISLVSSTILEETKRWTKVDFRKIKVPSQPISFIRKVHCWDFISIDAEGSDIEILKQIDLSFCFLLCIEWNSIESTKNEVLEYTSEFGMNKIIYQSGENLLISR